MADLRIYEVEAPDGKVIKVQAPSDATDAQIIAKVKRMRFSNEPPATPDPTKGGTLSLAGLDTGMELPDGVNRFLAGVGQHGTDMALGARQLIPGNDLTDEAKEKAQLDAPLLNTTGGKAGKLTGALVPAVSTMAIPGANTYSGAAATGALLGLLEPSQTGASGKLANAAGGSLFGVGGRAAGELVGRVVQPVTSTLNPEQSRLAQIAQSAGIPLDAAARTGSKPLQILNAVMENLPLTAGREAAKRRATQEAYNRAVLERTGSPATLATPDALAFQKLSLGKEFEDIATRNKLAVSPEFAQKLEDIKAQALKRLNQDGAPVASMVDDILTTTPKVSVNPGAPQAPFFGKVAKTYGSLDGKQYQGFREELGRLSRGNDTKAHYYADIKRALDREFETQLKGRDAVRWSELSREYGNTKTVLDAMGGAGNAPASGNISPAQLSAALAKQVGREGKALGRGDLNDLARIGQLFVRDQVPNSGTAQRMAYQGLLTGGVGAPAAGLGLMMTGSPSGSALYGLSATAASLLTPRLVQALANSAPVQGYMVRQAGNPVASSLADALRRAGPAIGLQAPMLLANGAQQ